MKAPKLATVLRASLPAFRRLDRLGDVLTSWSELQIPRLLLSPLASARSPSWSWCRNGSNPAAERVIGERHRNREIHADHANLYTIDEVAGRITIARKDRNAVSVFVLRWQPHGLFVVFCTHD